MRHRGKYQSDGDAMVTIMVDLVQKFMAAVRSLNMGQRIVVSKVSFGLSVKA
jgi:hypothetical protein